MNIGFVGLLQIVFIVLKLTNAIAWTWFWVFSPLWIPFALIGVICLCVFLLSLIKN